MKRKRASGVHRHDGLVVVVGELPDQSVPQDPGVVDQDVDPPGVGHDTPDDLGHLVGGGDVGRDADQPSSAAVARTLASSTSTM